MQTPRSSTVVADMIAVVRAVVRERSAVYVSAPITSGKRFFAAQTRLQAGAAGTDVDAATLAREVIEPNIAETAALAAVVRRRFGYMVIDPSRLVVPGWQQDHYIALWGAVVRTYARMVVFSDGWELSSGCTYEFAVAHGENIATVDAKLRPLTREDGIALILHAKTELEEHGMKADYLDERLAQLRGAPQHANGSHDRELDSADRSTLCSLMLGTVAPPRSAVVVCAPAADETARLAEAARTRAGLVVDPSAFVPAHWSPRELQRLWCGAIEAYAAEVVLGHGWEYSESCVDAFYHAAKEAISVKRESGETISVDEAIVTVAAAAESPRRGGAGANRLRDLLKKITELQHVA